MTRSLAVSVVHPNSSIVPSPRKRPSAPAPRLQDTVRLSAAGAGMLLGDLEHRVLNASWSSRHPATARTLFERVARTHDVVYITCVTVANRLVEKGLMTRVKQDDVFHYAATITKAEFTQRASRHVVQRLLTLGTTAVSASLVDVLAERDPAHLEELARLVRAKMDERRKRR